MNVPALSVVMPTYNHEKFVAKSIQSVLDQSFTDFELIIVNDGSEDRTAEVVDSFKDPRVRTVHQKNQGPSITTHNGIMAAQGEWVLLLSGDDIAAPERLMKQMQYVIAHPDVSACFGRVKVINEQGEFINHPMADFYDQVVRTYQDEFQLFHAMFFQGNQLHGVTPMFKKSCFLAVQGFIMTAIQTQDYFLWMTFLKHFKIGLLDEVLTHYRILERGGNLGMAGEKYLARSVFEVFAGFETVLNDISIPFFKRAFHAELQNSGFETELEFNLEKAFLYLKHTHDEIKILGLKRLFHLLNDPNTLAFSQRQYRFGLQEFFEEAQRIDFTKTLKVMSLEKEFNRLNRFWYFRMKRLMCRIGKKILKI